MKPASRKPSSSSAASATITRTVIPLPPGWEGFEAIPAGHPGEGWLSSDEYAKGRMGACTARRKLNQAVEDGRLESVVRKIGRSLIRFYRPVK